MLHNRIALILLMSAVAACDPAGGYRSDGTSPPGFAGDIEDGVDGLLVGHRLMNSGEYELALRSYYRAAAVQGITVDTLSAIGSAQLRLGRLGQAERTLQDAIALDETFPPAWNNLGVVYMEQSRYADAELHFRRAFALDSGQSADIRDNLTLALAKIENPAYSEEDNKGPTLVRRGTGEYLLLAAPE